MPTYRERVFWPGWFYLPLLGGAALGLVGAGRAILRDGSGQVALVIVLPLLVVAALLWRLRYIDLEFSRAGAAFGFGGLHRRVPRERIVAAQPEDYRVSRYMGWGYRLGWGRRERAYSVLGCRRGVRLVFHDERGRRWTIFLSSRNPEAAIAGLGA